MSPAAVRGAGWLLAGTVLLVAPVNVLALDPVTPEAQADLLFRTLTYNRTFQARRRGPLLVAVVTRPGGVAPDCMAAKAALAEQAAKMTTPVRVSYMAYVDARSFDEALTKMDPAVLYLCGSLTPEAAAVAELTRKHHICSFGATVDQVSSGMSTGFKVRDGRAGVMVNLVAIRAEGQDVDSTLLRFAEVMR